MRTNEFIDEHEIGEEALSKILGGVASGATGCFGFSNCCNDTCHHKEDSGNGKKKEHSSPEEDKDDSN